MKNFEKKKITFEKTRILYETKSLNLSVIKKLTSNATHAECVRDIDSSKSQENYRETSESEVLTTLEVPVVFF